MASLFDVLDALQTMALAATGALTGRIVDVAQGWPQPDDVDTAMKTGRTLISIYPVPSTTSDPGQIMQWSPAVIVGPAPGVSATPIDSGFTLAGTPNAGDYVSVTLSLRESYASAATAGGMAQDIVADLASQIGPRATAKGATLTISGSGNLTVRVGAPGTLGQQLHRQRQQFRIVVWSPTPADRAAVASAVDVALKGNLTFLFPDTSTGLLTFQTLNLDDRYEVNGCYRADLIWSALWDTYDLYPGYEIISVSVNLAPGPAAASSAY